MIDMEIIEAINAAKPEISCDKYRQMNWVKAGNYNMSVQGSSTHYCTPRESILIDYYLNLELAIFNKKGWFDATKSSVLKGFGRYSELIERYECMGKNSVFSYVPTDLINDLYLYLKGLT